MPHSQHAEILERLQRLEERQSRVEQTLWVPEALAWLWIEALTVVRTAAGRLLSAGLLLGALWLAAHLRIQP